MLNLLQRIPFDKWKKAKELIRRRYASRRWSGEEYSVIIDVSRSQLEALLRREHFEDASGWSIHYEGEVINMRRPVGEYSAAGAPLEEHIRFRRVEDKLEGHCHVEPNRWEAKGAHVAEEGVTWLSRQEFGSWLDRELGISHVD